MTQFGTLFFYGKLSFAYGKRRFERVSAFPNKYHFRPSKWLKIGSTSSFSAQKWSFWVPLDVLGAVFGRVLGACGACKCRSGTFCAPLVKMVEGKLTSSW